MYDTFQTAPPGPFHHDAHFSTAESITETKWSSLIGIITAIIGNVLISIALNTQRYAHIRIDREFNQGKDSKKARKQLPKSIRGYGTAVQQEQAAEERARINAEAPGLGNDEDDDTDAFGYAHKKQGQGTKRSESFGSEETAKPQEKDGEEQHARKSYLQSTYWWIGLILMVVGEAGNFLAYGFAPASIVSPLGVVALISNCLIAPWMLKEKFRQRDIWGVLISIAGAVVVVLSAKSTQAKLGPNDLFDAVKRWEFLTYIGITIACIIVLMFLSPKYGKRTILIDLGLVGLFGGYTALSTKGVASMLSGSLWKAFTFPITYPLVLVLIASAIMQIRYINRALSTYNSTQVIPIQFVLFTLSVIIGSAVLYRDFERTDVSHVIKFIIGCALTFSGVWLITSGRKNGDDDQEDGSAEETIQLIDEEAEAEDEHTPLKDERSIKSDSQDMAQINQRPNLNDTATDKRQSSTTIPSVVLTPYEGNLNNNPLVSSTEHLDKMARPRTPSNPRDHFNAAGTPFFTPSSASSSAIPPRLSALNRSDSSPADPQTPTRNVRGISPPKHDIPDLAPGDAYQTPPSTLLRSARGSISRLLPGPLLSSLSSSSINTVIAESLLRGEGSPRGPIRSRSYQKRNNRPYSSVRSERSRRRSTTAMPGVEDLDLESGLTTPTLSRMQTRDSTTYRTGTRGRRNTDDLDSAIISDDPRSSRPRLKASFSTSLMRFMSRLQDRGKDKENDEAGNSEASSSRDQNQNHS